MRESQSEQTLVQNPLNPLWLYRRFSGAGVWGAREGAKHRIRAGICRFRIQASRKNRTRIQPLRKNGYGSDPREKLDPETAFMKQTQFYIFSLNM